MSSNSRRAKFRTCDLDLLKSLLDEDDIEEDVNINQLEETRDEERPTNEFEKDKGEQKDESYKEDPSRVEAPSKEVNEESVPSSTKAASTSPSPPPQSADKPSNAPPETSHPSVHFAATPPPSTPPPQAADKPSNSPPEADPDKENRTLKVEPRKAPRQIRRSKRRAPPHSSVSSGPPSDRSGDASVTSKSSIPSRTSSRISRASSRRSRGTVASSTSSIGRRRIITNEERLEMKYQELSQLLSRNFLSQTNEVCASTLREARQLLHNTYAASRIVSGTVADFLPEARRIRGRRQDQEEYNDHDGEVGEVDGISSRWRPGTSHLPTVKFSVQLNEDEEEEDEDFFGSSSDEIEELRPRNVSHNAPRRRRERKRSSKERHEAQDARDAAEASDFPTTSAHPKSVPQKEQTLVGYGVEVPKPNKRQDFGSDHRLGDTENPFILRWLRRKNRLIRCSKKQETIGAWCFQTDSCINSETTNKPSCTEHNIERFQFPSIIRAANDLESYKEMLLPRATGRGPSPPEKSMKPRSSKKEKEKVDKAIDEELDRVREKRLEEASKAYQSWRRRKERQIRTEKKEQRKENDRDLSPRPDTEGAHADEGKEEEEELEGRPSIRGPKPIHNYVFRRSPSPRVTATPSIRSRKPLRMNVRGKCMKSAERPSQEQQQTQNRMSYDDWLKKKRSDSASRRKEEQRKQKEAAEAMDPDLSEVVPEMARQRIREQKERKIRVDSGLKRSPQRKPKTAEDSDKSKQNSTKPQQAYVWRPASSVSAPNSDETSSRRLSRPRSAKPRVGVSNFGRRPEPCGTDNPADDVPTPKTEPSILEEIVNDASEEEDESRTPEIPRLDLSGAFLTQGCDDE